MSELTPCNFCNLAAMKARAAARGVEVVVGAESVGLDIWTTARYSDKEEPSAWFLVLTAHCVC